MAKYAKYGNKKTYDAQTGITFDSKREYERFQELRLLERVGEIRELKTQVTFELQPSFKKNGKTIRAITYIADFTYYEYDTPVLVVEDSKGVKTEAFKIKQKLFEYKHRLNSNIKFLITS